MKALILTPPRVAIDADLAWLLRAAFAAVIGERKPENSERALHLVRTAELSGRVGNRLGAWRAPSELGSLGDDLAADYYENIAKEALLTQALDRIEQLGQRLSVPIIALKFAGLRCAGIVAQGSRAAADLDLLVPKTRARQFWRALLGAGFSRTLTHEYPHQLEALQDEYGAVVDLHVHVPGVTVRAGGYVTAEQLLERDLCGRTHGSLLVPTPALLAAHAIAHALLQNRSTPQTYSPLRMVADVLDLRIIQPDVVSLAADYLAPELGATCSSLELLCASLSSGVFDGPGFDGTSQQILLWHCLAARIDFDYSERLRAAGLRNKLRDGATPIELARYLIDLLYPASKALDVLYGPAVGPVAQVRRRLFRPIDLAIHAARRWARLRSR